MRTAITACLALLCLLFAIAADGSNRWVKYSSPEGHYSVSFPAAPRVITGGVTLTTGETVPQYAALTPSGYAGFMVGYFDLPAKRSYSLDQARDSMLRRLKATLLHESSISLGASPGRRLELSGRSASGGMEWIVSARIYIVGRRVYELTCTFPKFAETPAVVSGAAKFLDSFQAVGS